MAWQIDHAKQEEKQEGKTLWWCEWAKGGYNWGQIRTIIVLSHSPCGSTSLASLRASELARSMLAGVTARMRQFSLQMNCMIMSLIWYSMSGGWSPTGTLVMPGRSIRVKFKTAERKWEKQRQRCLARDTSRKERNLPEAWTTLKGEQIYLYYCFLFFYFF